MSTSIIRTLLLLLAGSFTTMLPAQHLVDIALQEGPDGSLEVRVVPQQDFDGIFSALLFTLRWERGTGAVLGRPVQEGAAAAYMPLEPSGGIHEVGAHNYQIYAGFGMQRLDQVAAHWEAGREYTIATIPVVEGEAEFELIVDAWTTSRSNNGSYYVSLGGRDRTGGIVKALAQGGMPGFSLAVWPNPSQGPLILTVEAPEAQDLELQVVNELGAIIFSEELREFQGTWKRELDLSDRASGTYHVHVRQGDRELTRKVLVQ